MLIGRTNIKKEGGTENCNTGVSKGDYCLKDYEYRAEYLNLYLWMISRLAIN